MYVTKRREASRQRREEIMHEEKAPRQAGTPRPDRRRRPYVVRDLSSEFARYAELASKRLHG